MEKEEAQAMEGEQNTEKPRNRTRVSMPRPPPLSPPPCSSCPVKSAQVGHTRSPEPIKTVRRRRRGFHQQIPAPKTAVTPQRMEQSARLKTPEISRLVDVELWPRRCSLPTQTLQHCSPCRAISSHATGIFFSSPYFKLNSKFNSIILYSSYLLSKSPSHYHKSLLKI